MGADVVSAGCPSRRRSGVGDRLGRVEELVCGDAHVAQRPHVEVYRHRCRVCHLWPTKNVATDSRKDVLQELVDGGVMAVAVGQRVADVDVLLDLLPDVPIEAVVADRFALMTLADALAARGYPECEWVVNQWSSASTAIAAFRQSVLDGPMSMAPAGRFLATLSVSHARVEPDTSGNVRMRKQHRRNRDDVAQSLVLAALIVARWRRVAEPTGRVWTLDPPIGEPATAFV